MNNSLYNGLVATLGKCFYVAQKSVFIYSTIDCVGLDDDRVLLVVTNRANTPRHGWLEVFSLYPTNTHYYCYSV